MASDSEFATRSLLRILGPSSEHTVSSESRTRQCHACFFGLRYWVKIITSMDRDTTKAEYIIYASLLFQREVTFKGPLAPHWTILLRSTSNCSELHIYIIFCIHSACRKIPHFSRLYRSSVFKVPGIKELILYIVQVSWPLDDQCSNEYYKSEKSFLPEKWRTCNTEPRHAHYGK